MPADSLAMFPDLTAELLRRGNRVRFRAIGASMQPTIEDGELITVAPVGAVAVKRGDILLYQNERGILAHRVVGVVKGTVPSSVARGARCSSEMQRAIATGTRYLLRGDASFSYDPPVAREQVIGRVVAVQRGDRSLALDSTLRNLLRMARLWTSKTTAFRLLHLIYRKLIKNS